MKLFIPIRSHTSALAPNWMSLGVGAALCRDDTRCAPQNRGIKPLLQFAFRYLGACHEDLHFSLIVILSIAKNPLGLSTTELRQRLTGFFTSFRTTNSENVCWDKYTTAGSPWLQFSEFWHSGNGARATSPAFVDSQIS